MADLPTGAVTFLFTYIEGSTPLWEQHPEAMRHALAHHDALLHRTIEARHGHVFKTMGDSFCAAFTTPEEAVQVAAEAQRALQRELPELRVRMAIYTGDAELRGGDYFGPALNRVSRLLAAGHGGQVLLSQTAVQQLRSSSPNGHDLRPLGEHRLRDLTSKEAIFQLVLPGLPSTFPPLNTLDVAFRRGMRRAALLSAVVLAVMAGLVITALDQAQRAKEQRQVALQGQRLLRQHLYAAQMNQAQQAWDEGNLGRAFELLEKQRPDRSGEEDLRGFEWRCLWRLCQGESWFTLALPGSPNLYNWLAFSPNGRLLAIGGQESIALWRV